MSDSKKSEKSKKEDHIHTADEPVDLPIVPEPVDPKDVDQEQLDEDTESRRDTSVGNTPTP